MTAGQPMSVDDVVFAVPGRHPPSATVIGPFQNVFR
jgi:hypothetical protein